LWVNGTSVSLSSIGGDSFLSVGTHTPASTSIVIACQATNVQGSGFPNPVYLGISGTNGY
jgi:hypothetical protein